MKKTERIERLEKEVKYLNKQVERMIDNEIYIFKLFIELYSPAIRDLKTEEHEE